MLWYFIFTVLILIIIPGPTMLLLIASTLSGGRKLGVTTLLGIITADCLFILSAVLGLTTLALSEPLIFKIIQWCGALYLIFIALQTFFSNSFQLNTLSINRENYRKVYKQGFITNFLNPKAAIFFVSIFSQFINPKFQDVTFQSLKLGLTFLLLSLGINMLIIAAVSKFSKNVDLNSGYFRLLFKFFFPVMLILIAIAVLFRE